MFLSVLQERTPASKVAQHTLFLLDFRRQFLLLASVDGGGEQPWQRALWGCYDSKFSTKYNLAVGLVRVNVSKAGCTVGLCSLGILVRCVFPRLAAQSANILSVAVRRATGLHCLGRFARWERTFFLTVHCIQSFRESVDSRLPTCVLCTKLCPLNRTLVV
jgi:hypothetical protein